MVKNLPSKNLNPCVSFISWSCMNQNIQIYTLTLVLPQTPNISKDRRMLTSQKKKKWSKMYKSYFEYKLSKSIFISFTHAYKQKDRMRT